MTDDPAKFIDTAGARAVIREHPDEECKFRRSCLCAVPIECSHGYDVCPTCDPCTCRAVNVR